MIKYGIINYSNNCYLNVIIQLLYCNIDTFNIVNKYLQIDNEKKLINPKLLLNKLSSKINTNIQNDAQEVFIILLELIPELDKYYNNKLKITYKCDECNKKRYVEDIFYTFYIYNESLEKSIEELLIKEKFTLECEKCKKKNNNRKKK